MAEAKTVRLSQRRTGSVVVVPEGKAAALKTLGFSAAEPKAAPKKTGK